MAGQEKRTSSGEKVAKGAFHGGNQLFEDAGGHMLRRLPAIERIVAKRVAPYGVDLVLGAGEATGPIAPVAAPVGAAIGGAFGEDIYDRNKAAVDARVHDAAGAIHRAHQAWDDSREAGQRRLDETARWIKARNAKLFGR